MSIKRNKLKRINLNRTLKYLNKNKYFSKHLFVGLNLRISFYGYGWSPQVIYGICTKTYNTKNFHSKINLYNVKQKVNVMFDLNQNIIKGIKLIK
jgi:hypothetical protein